MLDYPNNPTAILNPAIFRRTKFDRVLPSVNRGNVSVSAELQHISLIVYAVPSNRIYGLIPSSLQLEEIVINGQKMTWVSVESFLDKNEIGQTAFEQTTYRLHALRDGKPCRWLLGTSLGSLSGVGTRNLWPMPWHLSAMEFHIAYDRAEGRYAQYSLQTQSQWANSSWQIYDTGWAIDQGEIDQVKLPASIFSRHSTDIFARRDGSTGLQRNIHSGFEVTWAKLLDARCDLLESLGILTRQELMKPLLAALQHQATRQIFSPAVMNETHVQLEEPEIAELQLACAS